MYQVINNLFINAIKFAGNGKLVILKMSILEKKNSLLISVIDNGPGIPDKEKDRVFDKFHGDDTSKGKGLGLGLYICKRIVELHKGKIWVEDNPDGGAIFKMVLPI
ncbi:MAG: ATP-binding protein [Patescibacteria group bacterium]|nr:ATP-binding protein [Patescibacteria group bacterium]